MSDEFMRSRLFKPFETTKSAGMGVGVFESREYIQELGGRLDVASRVGEGTTFTLTLPLNGARAAQPLDEQQEESA
jgi:signal transduction histidine kinase